MTTLELEERADLLLKGLICVIFEDKSDLINFVDILKSKNPSMLFEDEHFRTKPISRITSKDVDYIFEMFEQGVYAYSNEIFCLEELFEENCVEGEGTHSDCDKCGLYKNCHLTM